MSDLKPNPFCGHPVMRDSVADDQHQGIVCAVECNDDQAFRMNDELWNSRPIEDALREENAALREALATADALVRFAYDARFGGSAWQTRAHDYLWRDGKYKPTSHALLLDLGEGSSPRPTVGRIEGGAIQYGKEKK